MDFVKFCIARLWRTNLATLSTRLRSTSIHVLLDRNVVVPQAVLNFLNRGARFIADVKHPGTPEILQAVDKLATSMNREVFFRDKPVAAGDSLFPPRCRLGTGTWQPPLDPNVELFRRLTKRACWDCRKP